MKTTIDIADELLRRAKAAAAREKTTLKAVLEDALRTYLRTPAQRKRAKIKPVVVNGHPEDAELLSDLLRDRGLMDRDLRLPARRRKGAA